MEAELQRVLSAPDSKEVKSLTVTSRENNTDISQKEQTLNCICSMLHRAFEDQQSLRAAIAFSVEPKAVSPKPEKSPRASGTKSPQKLLDYRGPDWATIELIRNAASDWMYRPSDFWRQLEPEKKGHHHIRPDVAAQVIFVSRYMTALAGAAH